MTDLEIDAIATGILTYIKAQTPDPRMGIAILGITLCKLYDDACGTDSLPFTTFAGDFHASLLATHKDVSSPGPVTPQ